MRRMKIKFRWRISCWSKLLFFLSSLHGGVEDGKPCYLLRHGRWWRRSSDTKIRAPLSVTLVCQPTHLASRLPFRSPDLDIRVLPTSMRRASSEFGTMDGRPPVSSIIGGGRGPDCLYLFLCRVFIIKSRDLSIICSFHEVFPVIMPVPLKN
jgi:hypothetical protein